METNNTNSKFLPIAVVAAGLLIAGAVVWNGSRPATPSTGSTGSPPVANGFGNAASIDKLDTTIPGLDAAKIAADVKANANTYQVMMDADKAEAQKAGVTATPSFVIGTQVIAGAYPYAAFQTALDAPNKVKTANVDIKNVKMDGNPFIGKVDAPVTVAFWSDFQCPYCKAFEVGGVPQIPTPAALPDIIKNYVDTGKVKIVFMDFNFLGNDSDTAGLYNRAVWKLYPDKYFAWRTAMYTAQDGENNSAQ